VIGDGDQPDLTTGDTGEWVERLQTRLRGLGRFDGAVDGEFGDSTRTAVIALQEGAGLPGTGDVDTVTWTELGHAEEAAGAGIRAGTLSEDQQWRWGSNGWEPNEDTAVDDVGAGAGSEAGGVDAEQRSADGQWLWDGYQWRAAPP
jgi:peptidoglycan hydrolase-like protein with peptidoglycan-binding domain